MTKAELEDFNAELIELLTTLRDQINEKLDELAAAEEDPDDTDDEDE